MIAANTVLAPILKSMRSAFIIRHSPNPIMVGIILWLITIGRLCSPKPEAHTEKSKYKMIGKEISFIIFNTFLFMIILISANMKQ